MAHLVSLHFSFREALSQIIQADKGSEALSSLCYQGFFPLFPSCSTLESLLPVAKKQEVCS